MLETSDLNISAIMPDENWKKRRFNCLKANKTDVLIIGLIFLVFDCLVFAAINFQPIVPETLHYLLFAHRMASILASLLLIIAVPLDNRFMMIPFLVIQLSSLTFISEIQDNSSIMSPFVVLTKYFINICISCVHYLRGLHLCNLGWCFLDYSLLRQNLSYW